MTSTCLTGVLRWRAMGSPMGSRPFRSVRGLQNKKSFNSRDSLRRMGRQIGLTANVCGVDVKTLYRKMQVYDLDEKQFPSGDSDGSEKHDEVEIS